MSQSLPLTNLGTRKSVANFSVSLAAAINAFKHFLTGSEDKNNVENEVSHKRYQDFYQIYLMSTYLQKLPYTKKGQVLGILLGGSH